MPTVPTTPVVGASSVDSLSSYNSTKIDVFIATSGGTYARVGRVQSISQDYQNNVQVLMELGSQIAVELKKGISTYSFSIAKMYVRTDVFDTLLGGAIFGLAIADQSPLTATSQAAAGASPQSGNASPTGLTGTTLEMFSSCAITSVSRSYSSGQATVAQNASVVVIGQSIQAPALY